MVGAGGSPVSLAPIAPEMATAPFAASTVCCTTPATALLTGWVTSVATRSVTWPDASVSVFVMDRVNVSAVSATCWVACAKRSVVMASDVHRAKPDATQASAVQIKAIVTNEIQIAFFILPLP